MIEIAARRFDTTHDILRSLSLDQPLFKDQNASILCIKNRGVKNPGIGITLKTPGFPGREDHQVAFGTSLILNKVIRMIINLIEICESDSETFKCFLPL